MWRINCPQGRSWCFSSFQRGSCIFLPKKKSAKKHRFNFIAINKKSLSPINQCAFSCCIQTAVLLVEHRINGFLLLCWMPGEKPSHVCWTKSVLCNQLIREPQADLSKNAPLSVFCCIPLNVLYLSRCLHTERNRKYKMYRKCICNLNILIITHVKV